MLSTAATLQPLVGLLVHRGVSSLLRAVAAAMHELLHQLLRAPDDCVLDGAGSIAAVALVGRGGGVVAGAAALLLLLLSVAGMIGLVIIGRLAVVGHVAC